MILKLAAIVGSVRQESFNGKIADFAAQRYAPAYEVQRIDIQSLPHFDQDIETDPPEAVKAFKQKIKEADAVLIVTPEYNHSVPGVLKNAIDWVSRAERVLAGKPVLIVGASQGFLGTVRCQLHLRQILAAPGVSARVLPGNEVFIGEVQNKMDAQGNLTDKGTIQLLDDVMEKFTAFIQSK